MTSVKKYQTISNPASAEITVKASRFIAFLLPVSNEIETKYHLKQIKSLHPKARHWCFAWRLGTDGNLYKSSDDGEPSGTAGKPILNQIDSMNLTQVILIVVRYFGGTLLGTSGLIQAYKQVSKKCIENANTFPFKQLVRYQINSNHTVIQILIGIFKELNFPIIEYSIGEHSNIQTEMPADEEDLYFKQIKSKLEKTHLTEIVNPKELKACSVIKISA